jgi:hypothetical protein
MFKVNDRVKIAKTSQYYGESDDTSNPMNGVGTIIKMQDGYLGIIVEWDNGHDNSYDASDLELAD